MYPLKTIREVFAYNLRELRGDRTQAEISESADIPFRTYQDMEGGTLPVKKWDHIASLSKLHNVSETRFFLDPDLTKPNTNQIIEAVTSALSGKTTIQKTVVKQPEITALISILSTLDDPELALDIVNSANALLRGARKIPASNLGVIQKKIVNK